MSAAIADRLEVRKLGNRRAWSILLDGIPVYADSKHLCEHFVEAIVKKETQVPGSSSILAAFEAKAALRRR